MKTATLQFKSSAVQLEAKYMALCFHQVFFFFLFFFDEKTFCGNCDECRSQWGICRVCFFLLQIVQTISSLRERRTKKQKKNKTKICASTSPVMFHDHTHCPEPVMRHVWVCVHAWVCQWVHFTDIFYSLLIVCGHSCLSARLPAFEAPRGNWDEISERSASFVCVCVCVCVCVLMPAGDSYVSSREQSDHAHRNL